MVGKGEFIRRTTNTEMIVITTEIAQQDIGKCKSRSKYMSIVWYPIVWDTPTNYNE